MSYSSEDSRGKNASLWDFFITIGIAAVFFIYFTLAIYTKDALWFWPIYSAEPSFITLRCYGKEVILEGDWPETKALTTMVNEQLTGDKRWDELNLTDQTYEYYLSDPSMMLLEFHYSEPQRIHSSSMFFAGFDTLIIPLDGRYANMEIVFSLINNKPAGSSFHINSFDGVREFLKSEDLCIKS